MAQKAADAPVGGRMAWGVEVVCGLPGDGINGVMAAEVSRLAAADASRSADRGTNTCWAARRGRRPAGHPT